MSDNASAMGMIGIDRQLRVTAWDPWIARISGTPAETAIGKPLDELIPDLEARNILPRIRDVLQNGTVSVLSSAFHRHLIACPPEHPSRNFETMRQKVTISPVREQESVIGAILLVEDVTPRLEAELDLKQDLQNPSETVRYQAARSLAEMDEDSSRYLTEALGDKSWRVRKTAVDRLSRSTDAEMIQGLIRSLKMQHANAAILNSALQVLAAARFDDLSPILALLDDPDPDLRMYTALFLGEKRTSQAIGALIRTLDDPDPNVVYHAIESLGKLRAVEAVDRLMAIAESEDFFLSFPAVDALARIEEPAVVGRLIALLGKPMLETAVIDALAANGDELCVGPLIDRLHQPDPPVIEIASALAAIYDRYEQRFGEGALIADIARSRFEPTGALRLIACLEEAPADRLRAVALVLGWLKSPAVYAALTRLLGEPSARREVIEALVRYGRDVLELLIEQLHAEDLDTRRAAVMAIGRIGDPLAVPELVRLLSDDPELIIPTAGALAKIGDRQAFESLLPLLGHRNPAVRQAVIGALNSIGHPDMGDAMADLMQSENPLIRESAIRIAGYFGYSQCIPLIEAACRDANETVRKTAIEHLPFFDDRNYLPLLEKCLFEDTPKVRAAAARALGHMDATDTASLLMRALDDPDAWVRYFSAISLGKLHAADAEAELIRIAQNDPSDHVRIAAAKALGRIGSGQSLDALKNLIRHENPDIARAAIAALGNLGHPAARDILLQTLHAEHPQDRLCAIQALESDESPTTIAKLQWVAASDSDPAVSSAAIEALARCAHSEAVRSLVYLTVDRRLREPVVAALAAMPEKRIGWVASGLEHPNPEVRIAIIDALGRMKRADATKMILGCLNDPDWRVRMAAIAVFTQTGNRAAEKKLAQLADNDPHPDVRNAARKALTRVIG
ncbi:MAG: HEAT repeat domain-containing protein [Thermodesulfobacteriota bacterium]